VCVCVRVCFSASLPLGSCAFHNVHSDFVE
jgi:hypothetical protein